LGVVEMMVGEEYKASLFDGRAAGLANGDGH